MDERKKDLCRYRLEKAEMCLASAKALVQLGDYCSAVNRSYYSIFHCIRALLALEGHSNGRHSVKCRNEADCSKCNLWQWRIQPVLSTK